MRKLLIGGLVAAFAVPAMAQDEFPMVGRWAFFEYGARNVSSGAVADACRDSWDSFGPDGALLSFSRNDANAIQIDLAGFCEIVDGSTISCTYLLDDTGPINEVYTDEYTWVNDDIIDYAVYGADGKLDRETSWTYLRCPPGIQSFR